MNLEAIMKKLGFGILLLITSLSAQAFTEACQLVAQMAGPDYQAKPKRFGSLTAPEDMPKSVEASFIERNGGWFIYQASKDWFDVDHCGPKTQTVGSTTYEFVPVLLNRRSGSNAVVNGVFLIKTYREEHIGQIAERYGFKVVTPLPNRFTAVFDVKPQVSYDKLIETLDRDRDVEFAVPLLSEPHYRPR
jgi:hypothetical protein